jgi:small subunit ribosomal protein S20
MPVTKTAKRARRSSQRKELVNKVIKTKLDVAIRVAKKAKDKKSVSAAIALTDKAAKKNLIHKNKASRLKSSLSRLLSEKKPSSKEKKVITSKPK